MSDTTTNATTHSTIGLLLVNLGTPEAPDVPSVRRFLKAFLSDPDVIQLPALLRWLLLHCFILPIRPYRTAEAYRAIWTKNGSPLQLHSQQLQAALQQLLGKKYLVALGMRYSTPHLTQAVDTLLNHPCRDIRVIPLFPQYATATTGSIKRVIDNHLAKRQTASSNVKLTFCNDFFDQSDYSNALAHLMKPTLDRFKPDKLLLSYHGLPVNQVKSNCNQMQPYPALEQEALLPCASSNAPCPNQPLHAGNRYCYRAQCYATSRAIAHKLGLGSEDYIVTFQSRLGRTPWIQPYTDKMLEELAAQQVKRLAVACPSFVTDCLETLEEIGIRAKNRWKQLGGEALELIPCLNTQANWVKALANLCINL